MSQHQIIIKLNSEMRQVLSTLSLMNSECQSLRNQLQQAQSELSKANINANEHEKFSSDLLMQNEAYERELDSIRETVNKLHQFIKAKEKEMEQCKLEHELQIKSKDNEIQKLKSQIIKIKDFTKISNNFDNETEKQDYKLSNKILNEQIEKIKKEAYNHQKIIVELNESLLKENNEVQRLTQKSENLICSCMKIYCYLNSPETFESNSEFDIEQLMHSNPKYNGIVSLFQSSEFYKNDFFKLVKDKYEQRWTDLTEKLSYSNNQRDQISLILDSRSKELSHYISENNKLQNTIEMQKNHD